jgi:hypothetical protein
MNKFNETGVLDIPQDIHAKACSFMASYAVSGARLGLALPARDLTFRSSLHKCVT